MPVTTRSQARGCGELYGNIDDRIPTYATMYPVFCTTNIPPKVLDWFIDEAYRGILLSEEDSDPPGAPCILQTTDLSSITHGSRKPMSDFESPFLNYTDNEIRDWMEHHSCPGFAEATFTILDQLTIDEGTCRVGYCNSFPDPQPDTRMFTTIPYNDLSVRVTIELGEISWCEIVEETEGTFTRNDPAAAKIKSLFKGVDQDLAMVEHIYALIDPRRAPETAENIREPNDPIRTRRKGREKEGKRHIDHTWDIS
ncbi:hypothetical protein A7C99_4313 [Trichophyton rubrum]|uniref:Uncharacterized protein n=4 Tax=Trichophyton TaxID=5550 RepID=A0A178F0D0_TRIRU|nr:hypothetical protein A7C99_4313 [Trichophyton rubrum]